MAFCARLASLSGTINGYKSRKVSVGEERALGKSRPIQLPPTSCTRRPLGARDSRPIDVESLWKKCCRFCVMARDSEMLSSMRIYLAVDISTRAYCLWLWAPSSLRVWRITAARQSRDQRPDKSWHDAKLIALVDSSAWCVTKNAN